MRAILNAFLGTALLLAASSSFVCSAQSQAQTPPPQPSAAAPTPPPTPARSVGLYVYPQKKQDAAQQQKDEAECFNSARQQSGIDPANLAASTPPAQAPKAPKGGGARGAAGGAAAGAAIGAVAGDAGTGAAVGATAGAIRGRRQQKKATKQAEQQGQQQQAAAQQQSLDAFKRAMSACLDSRGYSVK